MRFSIILWLFIALSFSQLSFRSAALVGQYELAAGSRLYLEGTSNVKDFSCHCTDPLPAGEYLVRVEQEMLTFSNTSIQIYSRSFDCGHRGINKDMYETLQSADHPYIEIELLAVEQLEALDNNSADLWTSAQAQLRMTIAGSSQLLSMPIQIQARPDGLLQCKGVQSIYLSDFELEAPRPMLGLIKVDDCIRIYLDLLLRLA